MMPGRMKNRSGRDSALLSLFPTCKRCSDKAGRAAVRPYRLATFDLDEKNTSGTKLKVEFKVPSYLGSLLSIHLQLVTSSACGGSTDFKRIGFSGGGELFRCGLIRFRGINIWQRRFL